jgi:hypothetical protein
MVLGLTRQDGKVVLELRRTGEPEPYFRAPLDAMLAVSTGRPWAPAFPGVREPEVRRTAVGLAVHCAVGPLAAEVELAAGDGALHADVTWRNPSADPIGDLAVGLALPLPAAPPESVTLPQVLYRGNPSADPGRTVPRLRPAAGGAPGGADGAACGGLVVEEHRLPVPCVHAEWPGPAGTRFLTMYARTPGAGSLGALAGWGYPHARRGYRPRAPALWGSAVGEHTTLLATSGTLMFDGVPDVAYTHKSTTSARPRGYRELAPGAALTTRHALRWGRPARPGHGFRDMVHHGLRRYAPGGVRPLSLDSIIELKTAALDRRWHEDGHGTAGYVKFTGSGHVPGFLYGWTGQCLRLAWCDARLGLEHGDERRLERSRRAVDFYLAGSAAGAPPGLRMSFHRLDDGGWTAFERNGRPFISARAFGDTLGDLADIVALLRDHGRAVPGHWTEALDEGLDAVCRGVPPGGVVPLGWRTDGSAYPGPPGAGGLPCVLALLKAERATGSRRHRRTAVRLLERYHERHADDFATPFGHATLDAACEDKEGGMAFFQCAYELLLLTGEDRYRDWAEATADWLLTWVYQWNPPQPPGSPFDRRGFDVTGWPGVSVQNHHVDVFFPVPELARFGALAGRPEYTELAGMVIHAFGQGICTRPGEWGFDDPGEQAEGFFPTDWQEHGSSNTWNPSWVTAHVLSGALRLRDAPAAAGGR